MASHNTKLRRCLLSLNFRHHGEIVSVASAWEATEMHGCVYGRLGRDPTTRNGRFWQTASVALNIDQERHAPPLWIRIVAFDRAAGDLLRHGEDDLRSVSATLQLNRWNDRPSSQPREQSEIIADPLVSVRTVRPAKRRRRGAPDLVAGGR